MYSRGLPQSVSHKTIRSEECAAVRLQGLELLVTVLLARSRQPPPTVAAGVPHAELAAELDSLPSGLLAMVCEAIVKLKVRRGSCVCVRSCGCIGDGRGPTRSRRVHGAGHECWRPCSPRVGPTVCGVHEALRVVTFAAGFRCGPVSDAESWRSSDDGAPPCAQPGLLGCARQGRTRARAMRQPAHAGEVPGIRLGPVNRIRARNSGTGPGRVYLDTRPSAGCGSTPGV